MSVYNDSRYLMQSIQSILDQTYPFFEFIIVNDGSTDNSEDIILSFHDDRIRYFKKENTGLADSLNFGIEQSSYEWIARMDGDDVALPTRFEEQVKMISSGYDLIGGQAIIIDENGVAKTGRPTNRPTNKVLSKLYVLLGWTPVIHPAVLINKKKLIEAGKYDTNFKASQDMDMWFRMSPSCKIVNTDKVVLYYRKHSGNISHSKKEYQRELSFLAYVKMALRIKTAIDKSTFDMLSSNQYIRKLIEKNSSLFVSTHNRIWIMRCLKTMQYYSWRLLTYSQLRINRIRILKQIIEWPEYRF